MYSALDPTQVVGRTHTARLWRPPKMSSYECMPSDLLAMSLSVIPIRPGSKLPLFPWGKYQSVLPDSYQFDRWLARYPKANWAVITGAISKVVVFDIDPGYRNGHLDRYLPTCGLQAPTWITKTPRGHHVWFRHPLTRGIPNRRNIFPGVDVRGDGGYVIVPPSVDAEGRKYAWITDPLRTQLMDLPTDLGI